MFATNTSNWSLVLLSILLIAGLLVGLSLGDVNFLDPTRLPSLATKDEVTSLQAEVAVLHNDVITLQKQVDALTKTPVNAPINSELKAINANVTSLNDRMQVIEQAVLDNPGKALELTLLSKDVENIQQQQLSDIQAVHEEIGRVYDLTKWVVGLLFVLATGLLSIAIGNLFIKPKKENEQQSKTKTKSR